MKNFYAVLFLLSFFLAEAQFKTDQNRVDEIEKGALDHVFDRFGRQYNLSDIAITKDKAVAKGAIAATPPEPLCTSGYFNLYFETGSGMEIVGNPDHDARRAVACQVFSDVSAFIVSPLAGNNKVNIWFRDFHNAATIVPGSQPLGIGSAFYNVPYSAASSIGGTADNEIWKTIHAGIDSYTNVAYPVMTNGMSIGGSGVFYHGMMAFNFNATTPAPNWNTNLLAVAPAGMFDLYTVMLHELMHAMGFTTLIDANGASRMGVGYAYYSRYDRFLKTGSNPLISNGSACSSMYDNVFNVSTAVLQPNTASCVSGVTTCGSAVKYGSASIPVYTPNCYETGSSLSHFEDLCIGFPNQNVSNSYFVMTDAIPQQTTKRFLKPDERKVLCDLGYKVRDTYGSAAALNSSTTYAGGVCDGISVAGINDGLNNGVYVFVGDISVNITINGSTLLGNDTNATGFECLQDITAVATLNGGPSLNGTSATVINFNSATSGLHLLRYVPVNASGQKGNITYVYVYVRDINFCAVPTACNMVINGDFETHTTALNGSNSNFELVCNWGKANQATPDYYNSDIPIGPYNMQVPCNRSGVEPDKIPGNHGYAGIVVKKLPLPVYTEVIMTKLASPLLPNTTYQLSFDVSLADAYTANGALLQAFFSHNGTPIPGAGYIPITNGAMEFTKLAPSMITNGWEKITFPFTTGAVAGEQFLYLGMIDQITLTPRTLLFPPIDGCNFITPPETEYFAYYYLDNVELVPLNGASFNLPNTICASETIHLNDYLIGLPPNGVFAGPGVTQVGDGYDFSNVPGVYTITYTYTNNLGCQITLGDEFRVLPALTVVPAITLTNSYCSTSWSVTTHSTVIPAGLGASWSITNGTGTILGSSYQSSVTVQWTSFPAELTLTYINANGCTSSTSVPVADQCACDCLATYSFTTSPGGKPKKINFQAVTSGQPCAGTKSYSWQFGDGTFLNGPNAAPTHTYVSAGVYTVSLAVTLTGTFENALCTGPVYSHSVTASPFRLASAGTIRESSVKLYPNPATSMVSIDLEMLEPGPVTIVVRSVDGKELSVYKKEFDTGLQTMPITLPSMASGMVLVEISAAGSSIIKKLVVL